MLPLRGGTQSDKPPEENHGQSFLSVFDSRKDKIPGLWMRGRWYATHVGVGISGPGQFESYPINKVEADLKNIAECWEAVRRLRRNQKPPGHREEKARRRSLLRSRATRPDRACGASARAESVNQWVAGASAGDMDKWGETTMLVHPETGELPCADFNASYTNRETALS